MKILESLCRNYFYHLGLDAFFDKLCLNLLIVGEARIYRGPILSGMYFKFIRGKRSGNIIQSVHITSSDSGFFGMDDVVEIMYWDGVEDLKVHIDIISWDFYV